MTVVLVEGESDHVALEAAASLLGRPMPRVVVLGGAHAARRVTAELRSSAPGERLVALVDANEHDVVAPWVDVVHVCDRDLEDEVIRALGVERVLAVLDAAGERESFGTLQRQPAQRDRSTVDQLRRFLGGRSGNKARYAALLVDALAPDEVPAPLSAVLDER
ncbi:hypothetical protein [Agrococcus jejuensis]|uniref:ATP-dependent endonuclease n=1 Tax=Agrococcus jejuensis TaxID=399736 RepID=A0A1G8GQX8_9MICO|nr:hypothetical protein [Agrococcus jejuensis]SDH96757.1 hypothetical protein SAMN04489720_3032 [Agrococcus jejuensis]